MKNNYHLYLGRAGHLIVMSEFLLRGWNVAIPEIKARVATNSTNGHEPS